MNKLFGIGLACCLLVASSALGGRAFALVGSTASGHQSAHAEGTSGIPAIAALSSAARISGRHYATAAMQAWIRGMPSTSTGSLTQQLGASSTRQSYVRSLGFSGNCSAYKSSLWSENQKTYNLMLAYVGALNKDYGTYPVPDGGSDPGATQSQYKAAFNDSATAQLILNDPWRLSGLIPATVKIARSHGVMQPWNSGTYNWAAWQVYMVQYEMNLAASGEVIGPDGGVAPFATAVKQVDTAWQALKQLPCK